MKQEDFQKDITKAVNTTLDYAQNAIAEELCEQHPIITSISAIKKKSSSTVNRVKNKLIILSKKKELRDFDLSGYQTQSMHFFTDTKNVKTTLLQNGTIHNSELLIIPDMAEQNAIGIPNPFLCEQKYGLYSQQQLDILEKFFKIKIISDLEENTDNNQQLEYAIYNIFPAKFNFDGKYYKLIKKGKLYLVPVSLEINTPSSRNTKLTTTNDSFAAPPSSLLDQTFFDLDPKRAFVTVKLKLKLRKKNKQKKSN